MHVCGRWHVKKPEDNVLGLFLSLCHMDLREQTQVARLSDNHVY